VRWNKTYAVSGSDTRFTATADPLASQWYLVGTIFTPGPPDNQDVLIVRVADSSGAYDAAAHYDTDQNMFEYAWGAAWDSATSGWWYVTGTWEGAAIHDGFIMGLDDMSAYWFTSYGSDATGACNGPETDFYDVELSSEGVVVAGQTNLAGSAVVECPQLYIQKRGLAMDVNGGSAKGTIDWVKRYSSTGSGLYSILEDSDGSYRFTGYDYNTTISDNTAWIVGTDEDGVASCNETPMVMQRAVCVDDFGATCLDQGNLTLTVANRSLTPAGYETPAGTDDVNMDQCD
jgi:hypothetical protein